jgi:drug/metabolite transporter (DMT)-like permease
MAVLLALLAAASYGISDFLGGFASRAAKALTVLLHNYPAGAVVMAALLPLFPGQVSPATFGWSVLGGVAGMAGVGLMYSAMAVAPMNVISPVTGVLAAIVPVLAGVALGERPVVLVWLGMLLALVAVVLITRTPQDHPHGPLTRTSLLMALGAGVGFGAYFVCLARTDTDSGLWPVVIARVASSLLVVPVAVRAGALTRLPARITLLALIAGAVDAASNLAFLLASRHGYLSVAGVITSLYPAGTVLLAIAVLKERTGRIQWVGMAVAVVAVVLVTSP